MTPRLDSHGGAAVRNGWARGGLGPGGAIIYWWDTQGLARRSPDSDPARPLPGTQRDALVRRRPRPGPPDLGPGDEVLGRIKRGSVNLGPGDFHRRRRRAPAPAPPESSGSYGASGGRLQAAPPRGARAAGGAAVVLERLANRGAGGGSVSPPPRRQVVLEGGRLRGDGRAADAAAPSRTRDRQRFGAARESTTHPSRATASPMSPALS